MIPMHVLRNSGMVFSSWRDGGVENWGGISVSRLLGPEWRSTGFAGYLGPALVKAHPISGPTLAEGGPRYIRLYIISS